MKHIVVLTGAGMSAASGIATFRDANGLWENHDIMDVATPEGFKKNPELVLRFYNQRRKQLKTVQPNKAHLLLASLEKNYQLSIITQNVDDLHERAGSSSILHLHGELKKVRSVKDPQAIIPWEGDLTLADKNEKGHKLRPHVVWFGEEVPELENAANVVAKADVLLVIGTSLQVYPAANLVHYTTKNTPIYLIDPKPALSKNSLNNLTIINKNATEGLQEFIDYYLNERTI